MSCFFINVLKVFYLFLRNFYFNVIRVNVKSFFMLKFKKICFLDVKNMMILSKHDDCEKCLFIWYFNFDVIYNFFGPFIQWFKLTANQFCHIAEVSIMGTSGCSDYWNCLEKFIINKSSITKTKLECINLNCIQSIKLVFLSCCVYTNKQLQLWVIVRERCEKCGWAKIVPIKYWTFQIIECSD